ncbi:MAG: hypothetical protein IPH52_16060 [Leptospiraceae bacterium]|nr:hypothetical protein [Leptospiraceae bacterium]
MNGFEDEVLNKILEEKIKSNPVFVQVGKKVPARLTNKYLFINKHCSILPAYAGVNPVFWKMLKKEKYQGVTVHRMDENFDTGKILLQSKIENRGNLFSIYHTLYDLTSELLLELKSQDTLDDEGKNTGLDYTYYSYPNKKDIKAFLNTGNKFGLPFRLHPRIGGL